MQKLLFRLSPLFLLLLFFACAKDNELKPLPAEQKAEQMLQAKETVKPCTLACRKPDWINIDKLESCSALLSWGHNQKICGTFTVQLYNHSTEEWTYFNSAISPFALTDLEPCTQYTVGVSHGTDKCESIPLKFSFQTNCKPCKDACAIPCEPLDYFFVEGPTNSIASIHFGHTPSICGTFSAQLVNGETGAITYFNSVTSPWVLTDLEECTAYTVRIYHVTDKQACLPAKKSFSTLCGETPCEIEVLSELSVYTDQLGFDAPGVIEFWDNDFQCTHLDNSYAELCPSEPYMLITEPVLRLEPNADFTLVFCYWTLPVDNIVPVDINMWIDYNDDGNYSADELVIDFNVGPNSGFCVGDWEPENIPSVGVCGVPARYIVSLNEEIVSPCDDVQTGQVIDFFVNIGACGIES